MIAHFKDFDKKLESFTTYVKRLEHNFVLHYIKEKKNVPALS